MHKTLKGVFAEPKVVPRRNFLKENKMNIKRMQQSCDEIKYKTAQSPVNFITTVNPKHNDKVLITASEKQTNVSRTSLPKRQISKDALKMKNLISHPRSNSALSNITVKDQGIQTENDTKEESFLRNTIIRYPSSTKLMENSTHRSGSLKKEGSTHSLGKSVSIRTPESGSINGDYSEDDQIEKRSSKIYSDPKADTKGRILKSPVLHVCKTKLNHINTQIPQNYKLGVVPKYIKERKEELANIEKEGENIDLDCPDGHILLPDKDRLKALEIAKKRFDLLIQELNKMPMTSETLRIRNRKIEIEKELTKLEDSIRIFSRTKVYVKLTV
uniref:CSON005270 protein n=1 Tax=Culicoides sonorensis TaxID=179676 RepID=A0A336LND0_CULSO